MTTLTAATTTDVRRALLTLLVAVPWSLGWLAGALVTLTLYAVTAACLGFTDARQFSRDTNHAGHTQQW